MASCRYRLKQSSQPAWLSSTSNTTVVSSALTAGSMLLPTLQRRALPTRQCLAVRRLLRRWKWWRFNVGADCRRLKNDLAVCCFPTIAVSCALVTPTTPFAASCMQYGLEMQSLLANGQYRPTVKLHHRHLPSIGWRLWSVSTMPLTHGSVSEWVRRVLHPIRHSIGHFGDGLSRQNAHKHIIMER